MQNVGRRAGPGVGITINAYSLDMNQATIRERRENRDRQQDAIYQSVEAARTAMAERVAAMEESRHSLWNPGAFRSSLRGSAGATYRHALTGNSSGGASGAAVREVEEGGFARPPYPSRPLGGSLGVPGLRPPSLNYMRGPSSGPPVASAAASRPNSQRPSTDTLHLLAPQPSATTAGEARTPQRDRSSQIAPAAREGAPREPPPGIDTAAWYRSSRRGELPRRDQVVQSEASRLRGRMRASALADDLEETLGALLDTTVGAGGASAGGARGYQRAAAVEAYLDELMRRRAGPFAEGSSGSAGEQQAEGSSGGTAASADELQRQLLEQYQQEYTARLQQEAARLRLEQQQAGGPSAHATRSRPHAPPGHPRPAARSPEPAPGQTLVRSVPGGPLRPVERDAGPGSAGELSPGTVAQIMDLPPELRAEILGQAPAPAVPPREAAESSAAPDRGMYVQTDEQQEAPFDEVGEVCIAFSTEQKHQQFSVGFSKSGVKTVRLEAWTGGGLFFAMRVVMVFMWIVLDRVGGFDARPAF